jgi:hypothetical protein
MASLVSARIGAAAIPATGPISRDLGGSPAVQAAANPPRAAAATTSPRYPELGTLIVGALVLAAAWAVALWAMPSVLNVIRPETPTFDPPDGISAFALFFLAATVVERVIEPFSSGLVRASSQQEATRTTTAEPATGTGAILGKSKAEALQLRSALLAGIVSGTSASPEADAKKAAAEQATAEQAVVNAGFIVWAVATLVAVPIISYFGLSLPVALGVTNTNSTVDVLISALVVGAGTKPLHDFLSNIEKSSASKDTDSPT